VRDTDPELLRYLSDLGVVPETHVTITDYSEFDGNIHLRVEGNPNPVVLGPRITEQIFIEEE
jgi:Fe2+ transport system protein FeoA